LWITCGQEESLMYQPEPSTAEERKITNQIYAAMGIMRRVRSTDMYRLPTDQLFYLKTLCESLAGIAEGEVIRRRNAADAAKAYELAEKARLTTLQGENG